MLDVSNNKEIKQPWLSATLLKMKFNIEHIIFIYIQYGNEIKFIGNV
jgi:hypothetical protein